MTAEHILLQDFEDRVRKWHSCDPFQLFDARIETYIDDVSVSITSISFHPPDRLVASRNSNRWPRI
jgi:hypothetical protein